MLSKDPENAAMYRAVMRGTTHERQRPQSERFSGPISSLDNPKRKLREGKDDGGIIDINWIGRTWIYEHNNGKLPSLNQI